LRLIPQDIIEDAKTQIRETLRAGAKADPEKAKKQVLDSFATIGVQPKNLEEYLKHGMDTVSPAEIVDLRAIYTTIKNGEATWKAYVDKEEVPAKEGAEKAELGGDLATDVGFAPGDPKTHQDVKTGAKKK